MLYYIHLPQPSNVLQPDLARSRMHQRRHSRDATRISQSSRGSLRNSPQTVFQFCTDKFKSFLPEDVFSFSSFFVFVSIISRLRRLYSARAEGILDPESPSCLLKENITVSLRLFNSLKNKLYTQIKKTLSHRSLMVSLRTSCNLSFLVHNFLIYSIC